MSSEKTTIGDNFISDWALYNIEAEKALLGTILLDNSLLENIPYFFASLHFYVPLHATIYDSIKRLQDVGSIADPITLANYLSDDPVFIRIEGKQYLVDLVASIIGLSSIADYANIIFDLYLRRQLMVVSEEIVCQAKGKQEYRNAEQIIENTEKRLYDLATNIRSQGNILSFGEALSQSIESAANALKRDSHIAGIATGFKKIDELLGGLHKSDLVIVAGRPSMGKTALATNIAFNAAQYKLEKSNDGAGVIFFSLEMSAEQLATRILATESGIPSDSLRRGAIPKDAFSKFVEISRELESLDLFIDESSNITVSQIRARIRRVKRQHDIGLVVIDYLQLINAELRRQDNRVNEVSEITRGLKGIAKEFNIPIIALSQLSRAVEQRDDKKPQLADLRESGSIEQDADVVMFIFREEYYKARKEPAEETAEHERWQNEMEKVYNRAEIIVAKHRHGRIGSAYLFFDSKLTKFGNLLS
jgi:replicative DNA helicase